MASPLGSVAAVLTAALIAGAGLSAGVVGCAMSGAADLTHGRPKPLARGVGRPKPTARAPTSGEAETTFLEAVLLGFRRGFRCGAMKRWPFVRPAEHDFERWLDEVVLRESGAR